MRTFDWRPGIGDPSLLGWGTVLMYLLAALGCWWLARDQRCSAYFVPREQQVWLGIALLMLALGINKQLDLQSALTEIGRVAASYQGWYEHRRTIQLIFVGAVAVGGAVALGVLISMALRLARGTLLASIGVTVVAFFVLIRAASFHHIDVFISSQLLGLRWNWILEIGGILIVQAGALLASHDIENAISKHEAEAASPLEGKPGSGRG